MSMRKPVAQPKTSKCKGQVNAKGTHLLNFSIINNLKLVNTFKHKATHITTWTSPETPQEVKGTAIETRSTAIL